MKLQIILFASLLLTIAACKPPAEDAESMKAALAKLKSESADLQIEIDELEGKIIAEDPSFGKKSIAKATLIETKTVTPALFTSFIEFPAEAKSKKNAVVSAEQGGIAVAVYAKEGQTVSGGATLVKIDDKVIKQNMIELETQTSFAKTVYEKRKRLWDQNIGAEIDYLQAKTNYEGLQKQMNTLQTQASKSSVIAPFSGVVEEVMIKQGEMASPGVPLVRVVNLRSIEVETDLSESYLGQVKRGDKVEITFPSLAEPVLAKVSNVSQILNATNRTFKVQIDIPNGKGLIKPNMTGLVKVQDYAKEDAIVVSSKILRQEQGKSFVFVANDSKAERRNVTTGKTANGNTEILTGLVANDQLITVGSRDLTDGAPVKIAN